MSAVDSSPNDADLNPAFSSVEEIVADISEGKMVIIVDDEDRENEGDLLMAADCVEPHHVNHMATHGRGLICLTLTRERCKQLRLPLMVDETDEQHATNFTLSIEAVDGVTTGISAHDRARTIRAAVAADAKPEDLIQPGPVFPIMAQPGGVLTRAGHTEAGCDLARMAGHEPAAVIVEILNDDGTMARRPQLELFAVKHGLKIGSIADLIRYRLEKEQSVERISSQAIETEFGEFEMVCFEDHISHNVHLALVKGDLQKADAPLVRVHLQDTLADVVGVKHSRLGWPLRSAMRSIAEAEAGVVIILRYEQSARQLVHDIAALGKSDSVHAVELSKDEVAVLRTHGTGAQILRDLGITRMRVLSAPKHILALSGFGLEVVEYVDH